MQTSKSEMPTLRAAELKSLFSSLMKDSIVIKHRETSYKKHVSFSLSILVRLIERA